MIQVDRVKKKILYKICNKKRLRSAIVPAQCDLRMYNIWALERGEGAGEKGREISSFSTKQKF